MRELDTLRKILEDIRENKTIIFDYEKVSNLERELFLSVNRLMKVKFDYELDGFNNTHLMKFLDYLKRSKVDADEQVRDLITTGFILNSMITKRNLSLGYGETDSHKVIENKNLVQFLETLEKYIENYEYILANM